MPLVMGGGGIPLAMMPLLLMPLFMPLLMPLWMPLLFIFPSDAMWFDTWFGGKLLKLGCKGGSSAEFIGGAECDVEREFIYSGAWG